VLSTLFWNLQTEKILIPILELLAAMSQRLLSLEHRCPCMGDIQWMKLRERMQAQKIDLQHFFKKNARFVNK
jgi:hypothetical protein